MHAVMGSKQGGCIGEGRVLEDPRLNIVVHPLAHVEGYRNCETTSFVFTEERVRMLSSSGHVRLKVVQDVVPDSDQISPICPQLMVSATTYIIGARWNHILAFPRFTRAVRSAFFVGNEVLRKRGSV